MRHSTFLKFVAVLLCAAALLGMVGSGAAMICLSELGDKNVHEAYQEQLESQAMGFARTLSEIHLSQELGGMSRQAVNYYYGNDWENGYFVWSRVGYTLYDSQGAVVQEQQIPSNRPVAFRFSDIPVFGTYMNVLSTTPVEEPALETQPGPPEQIQVAVMPAQESTAIGAVYVDYTDGHHEEWSGDGQQLGILAYAGGDTVTFFSSIGEFPMGDGWYPNHVLMLDMGGNVAYEVTGNANVILGSELGAHYDCQIHLPAGTVTTAAPVGMTHTAGEYSCYDAIPTQGATVSNMHVTYANRQGETVGSEGVSSPELIGTLFHRPDGNAQFRSTEPMTMDIPEDGIITHILFQDAQNSTLFEASCPGGVGVLTNDHSGNLVFQGQMPGTEIPEETAPEEIAPEETAPEETAPSAPETTAQELRTIRAWEEMKLYNVPSLNGQVLGKLKEGQEVAVSHQETFTTEQGSNLWGLTEMGWIVLDDAVWVTDMSEAAPAQAEKTGAEIYAAPNPNAKILGALEDGEAPEIIKREAFNGVTWGLTSEGWLLLEQEADGAQTGEPAAASAGVPIPEETTPEERIPEESISEETTPESTLAVAAEEPAVTEPVAASEEAGRSFVYYDNTSGQHMTAEYVMEPIPEGYTVEVRLAAGALHAEFEWALLRVAYAFGNMLLQILGVCAGVFALCVVYLCCAAARKRGSDVVRAGGLNRIPLDLYVVADMAAGVGLVFLAVEGGRYLGRNDQQLAVVLCGAGAYLLSLLIVGFFFAFVAQIKTPGGFWWRNSLCGRCLKLALGGGALLLRGGRWTWNHVGKNLIPWTKRLLRAVWKLTAFFFDLGRKWLGKGISLLKQGAMWLIEKVLRFYNLLPMTWQWLLTGFVMTMILYIALRSYKVGWLLIGFGIFFGVILYGTHAFGNLLESVKRMAAGDLDSKVDDKFLVGCFREFAVELNDLADVAMVAAQKQLKSERMKTELITNVSHDIKTPLTSIINYVDLMEKPHTPEEQAAYLEVLSRQSQRLKKLIDDLMDMSKASTGNLTVEIGRVNAGEAIHQALGEFADKLDRAELIPVFRQPEEPVEMMADGRLVWRVMSNLLSNAVKYALPGTRVYLDLAKLDGKVIISMKNISREELNVSADELLERFVRGDASRNTEGSGLGLNIAQSLMELQKGQLQLLVDGDLFKVTLIFPGI